MFGGLEVKGDAKKDNKAAAAPSSGFSFLNSGAPPAPAPEPAPSSAFGFMGGGAAVAAPAPASSGFSFMGGGGAAAPPTTTTTAPANDPPPPVAATTSPSSFSFMGGTPPVPPTTESPKPVVAAAPSSVSSGFSFMDANKPPESTATTTTAVGAGVTFGGAAMGQHKKKPIKKRSRKVGGGRGDGIGNPPPRVETNSTPEDTAATVRMQLQQQSRLTSSPKSDDGMRAPTSSFSVEKDEELEEARRAAQEAQAYLQKESHERGLQQQQQNQHQQQAKSAFSWFTNKNKDSNISNNSGHTKPRGSRAPGSNHAAAAAPRDDPTNSAGSSVGMSTDGLPAPHELNPVSDVGANVVAAAVADAQPTEAERIAREQEEIKRAMAERHMAMMDDPTKSRFQQQVMPPPAPPSPKEILHRILRNFRQEADQAMGKVLQLRQQRNMLLDERFVALAKERLAVQQIAQAESQQAVAAEQEDFDLADRLQVVIDGLTREKAETDAILNNLSSALQMLENQTPAVVERVADCFEQVEFGLKEFKEQQTEVEKCDDSEAMARFSATAKQLSAEEERLKSELKHLERDADQVAEERKELDAAILENTTDMEKDREKAAEKLTQTEKEIMELKEKLREKETEAARLRSTLTTYDQDINRVLLKFTRQITRVQKKETSLAENRKEWENEQKAYDSLKGAHEAEVKAHSDALLQHNVMMDEIKKEIGYACTFRYIVSEEVNFDDARKDGSEEDQELAQLQADVVKTQATFAEANTLLKAAEAKLVELDGERKRLEARVPKLEEQKKSAAAKRDFKTAGKASKEIKEAKARLELLESELLEEAAAKRAEASEEVSRAEQDVKTTRTKADAKERESGIVSMEKVAEKIRHLLVVKKKGCSGDMPPNGVQSVAALILKAQISALKLEGETYGEKFGGWDAIADTLEDEDDEKEQARNVTPTPTTEPVPTEEPAIAGTSRPSDEVVPSNVRKGRELTKRLLETETSLEAAAAEEDYDKAAELNDVLEELQQEVVALDLTDAETDLVMDTDAEIPEEPKEEVVEEVEEPQEEAVEDKSEPENDDDKVEEEKEEETPALEAEPEEASAPETEAEEPAAEDEEQPATTEEKPKEDEQDDEKKDPEEIPEDPSTMANGDTLAESNGEQQEANGEEAKPEMNGVASENGHGKDPTATESDDNQEFFDAEEATEELEAAKAGEQ